MTRRRKAGFLAAAALVIVGVGVPLAAVESVTGPGVPAVVKGFDEAGVTGGLGDNFTVADWTTIKRDGFRLFITDPVKWSSECSGGTCATPVNACTIDPAAITQIRDAFKEGIDYAVYTRNVNCLTTAIRGLPLTLQAHLSFAVLDIEPGPSVRVTGRLVHSVKALGQTPLIYSYQAGWQSVMGPSAAFRHYPLQDGEVNDWNPRFPAAYPSGYPRLVSMPGRYGGWSGAQIEQQVSGADIQGPAGAIDDPADQVDLDAVSGAWLARLPHQA